MQTQTPTAPSTPAPLPRSGARTPRHRPRRHWIQGLLILSLIAGVGTRVWIRTQGSPSSRQETQQLTTAVTATDLTVTIEANGRVEPQQLVNVSPKISGILEEMLVEEGEWVETGQILARMENQELQAQVKQAQAQVLSAQAEWDRLTSGNRPEEIAQAQARLSQAQANLVKLQVGNRPEEIAQAQARLEQLEADLERTQQDFERTQMLADEGAISQQELDTARSNLTGSQAQVEEARQALILMQTGSRAEDITQAQAQVEEAQQSLALLESGSRAEEIAIAQAQVIAAEGSLQEAQARLASATLRAPFAGQVTRQYADLGAFVTPTTSGSSESSATSTSILALASTHQIVASVAESDIAQVQAGQPVTITADAYPNHTFWGEVIQISPQAIEEQNVTSFEITVDLLEDPPEDSPDPMDPAKTIDPQVQPQDLPELRIGMNVTLEIQVDQRQDVLTIPTVAIHRQDSGSGVYVADPDSGAQFTPITTGVTVGDQTEVISGLTGAEQIWLTAPEGNPRRSQAQSDRGPVPFLPSRPRRIGGL